MTFITNEKLAAYADGELDEIEAAHVSRALDDDELLRARFVRMKALDDQLRAAFAEEEEIPRRLARLVEPRAAGARAQAKLRRWLPAGAAIAAGVAGVVVGGLLPPQGDDAWLKPHGGVVALAGAVQAAADRTPSGSRYVDGTLAAEPVLSFVAGDGRLCRELQVDAPGVGALAVVCREQGEWRVEALVRAQPQKQVEGYRPAGARRDPTIEAAHARLNIETVLDANAEDAAIAGGWFER